MFRVAFTKTLWFSSCRLNLAIGKKHLSSRPLQLIHFLYTVDTSYRNPNIFPRVSPEQVYRQTLHAQSDCGHQTCFKIMQLARQKQA